MRVCVVMFYDESIIDYAKLTHQMNEQYCTQHGLDFIVSHEKTYGEKRHAAYEKIPLVLRHLPDYDYVVWVDADACFYPDDAWNIRKVIQQHPNHDFIFSLDKVGENINTGVFFVKNTDYSVGFLSLWAYDEDLYQHNSVPLWWDQGILVDMVDKNVENIRKHSISLPYGVLQHFGTEETFSPPPYLLHLAGKTREQRVDALMKQSLLWNHKDYESYTAEKNMYLNDLQPIILQSNSRLEGNCFYAHETLNIYPDLYTKQLNLFWCGKFATSRMCEIGFNAGHSCMLLLLGRQKTPLEMTVFDIGHHSYTKPCFDYIQSKFPHVHFEYVQGDSTLTMPKWIQENPEYEGSYDVIHVDGGHSEHCISMDMKHSHRLLKVHGIMIINDTNCPHINQHVDLYLAIGKYKELKVLLTKGYPHRILQKTG